MIGDDDPRESEYRRARQIAEGLHTEGHYRADMHLRVGFVAVTFGLLAVAAEIHRAARQITRALNNRSRGNP